MRYFSCILLFFLWAAPTHASGVTLTLFLDGAREEREMSARKGYLELELPAAMLPNTLRVRPMGNCEITRVQVVPVARDRQKERERVALEERRAHLRDRLKALEEREDIFRAAAKSQSSKALRKTKNNPEPMESVRKGTDFALAQLEAASISSRKAERELAALEARLDALRKERGSSGLARVWLSTPDARVRLAFLLSDMKWIPWYDFRLSGTGTADIRIRAKLPANVGKSSLFVSPLTLSEANGSDLISYPVSEDLAPVSSFRLSLAKEEFTKGPASSIFITFANTTGRNLPAGEASGYWQGEYLGRAVFGGCRPNESLTMVIGK